ncbi:phosphatase 2C, partial [Thalictrum thalictroides]
MAELCGIVDDTAAKINNKSTTVKGCDPISLVAKRKRMERRRFKIMSAGMAAQPENRKCQKLDKVCLEREYSFRSYSTNTACDVPEYGVISVCGRRREMEDAVAIHPEFCHKDSKKLHFFGVYDGHGCSHVAKTCKDRLHQIVKEEIEQGGLEWKETLEKSFSRLDKEVLDWSAGSCCKCMFQLPKCDAAGSTAVVSIVTPEKIITANCGDSRAVLCRGGKAIPLSFDHKPDRHDERLRIEAAGGHIIYWDVPRVVGDLGVLAMSRAI